MANSNCLEDIHCPHCFNDDRFYIETTVTACVTDDGAEPANGNFRWDANSWITCPDCYCDGTVAEFTWSATALTTKEVAAC
jgi:hypothetical protein